MSPYPTVFREWQSNVHLAVTESDVSKTLFTESIDKEMFADFQYQSNDVMTHCKRSN